MPVSAMLIGIGVRMRVMRMRCVVMQMRGVMFVAVVHFLNFALTMLARVEVCDDVRPDKE